jgi:hypothetical protein
MKDKGRDEGRDEGLTGRKNRVNVTILEHLKNFLPENHFFISILGNDID